MNSSTSSGNRKTYRVAQWAAGRIGRSAMRAVIRHPAMELVALHVHSPEKENRDAGELCGLDAIGVPASRSIDHLIARQPDCVLYMQEGYDVDDMCRLLSSGINIITTRSEFFHAGSMDPLLRQRLEEACQRGASSLHATGSSPGFSTEILPLALLSLSRRLDCLTVDEFADIPASTSPEMITEVMGFGRPVAEEFSQLVLDHVSVGFAQSLNALADGLGLHIDRFESTGEFATANAPVTLPGGAVIEQGMMAAQRITVAAMQGGSRILQFRANWYCSRDIDQDWELGENGWRVVVEGDTPMDVKISFPRSSDSYADQMSGLTAHPAVNAIPRVCDAAPGLVTNVDLPPIVARLV